MNIAVTITEDQMALIVLYLNGVVNVGWHFERLLEEGDEDESVLQGDHDFDVAEHQLQIVAFVLDKQILVFVEKL